MRFCRRTCSFFSEPLLILLLPFVGYEINNFLSSAIWKNVALDAFCSRLISSTHFQEPQNNCAASLYPAQVNFVAVVANKSIGLMFGDNGKWATKKKLEASKALAFVCVCSEIALTASTQILNSISMKNTLCKYDPYAAWIYNGIFAIIREIIGFLREIAGVASVWSARRLEWS